MDGRGNIHGLAITQTTNCYLFKGFYVPNNMFCKHIASTQLLNNLSTSNWNFSTITRIKQKEIDNSSNNQIQMCFEKRAAFIYLE